MQIKNVVMAGYTIPETLHARKTWCLSTKSGKNVTVAKQPYFTKRGSITDLYEVHEGLEHKNHTPLTWFTTQKEALAFAQEME